MRLALLACNQLTSSTHPFLTDLLGPLTQLLLSRRCHVFHVTDHTRYQLPSYSGLDFARRVVLAATVSRAGGDPGAWGGGR